MCKASTDPKHIEEENLLHKRKQVEEALYDFQSYFLHQKVFYSYNVFIDTTRLVPTTFIKVYQGREYQAFCEYWREIVLANQAYNKIKVKFTHNLGIEEKHTYDADGLHNSLLTNCWKKFVSMPFVSKNALYFSYNAIQFLYYYEKILG